MTRLLNIGCGGVFHPDWVNLDADPVSADVMAHDVHRGLPFPAESFDAVYGSHVLEHLSPAAGARLLSECRRVLKPLGIARLAVPDLEAIARLYLQSLEGATMGDAAAAARHEWAMLELYDQAVRTESGGAMGVYLRRPMDEQQKRFVTARIGEQEKPPPGVRPSVRRRLARLVSAGRRTIAETAAYVILGAEGRAALREGLFRRGGEVHQWMYDRFSLLRTMESAGFVEVRICAAEESRIAAFARYGLETANGRPRKPDSLYAEGRKPVTA